MTSTVIEQPLTLPIVYKYDGKMLYCYPGDTIWIKGEDVVHFNGLSGSLTFTSSKAIIETTAKITASKVKLLGWTLVAEGPSKALLDVPVEVPNTTFSKETSIDVYAEIADYAEQAVGYVFNYGMWASHGPVHVGTSTQIAQYYATFVVIRDTHFDGMSSALKGKVTKTLNTLQQLYSLSILYRRTIKDDYVLTREDEGIYYVVTSGLKSWHSATYYLKIIAAKFEAKKFFETLDIGFDITNASSDQFKNYAVNNGALFAEGMTDDMVYNWIQSFLNVPNYNGSTATDIEGEALTNIKIMEIAAKADSVMARREQFGITKAKALSTLNKPMVSGDQSIAFKNSTINIPENSYVTINPQNSKLRIYMTSNWNEFYPDGTFIKHNYPTGYTATKAHQVDISCSWIDHTPNWDMSFNTTVLKPGDVSEEIWKFVIGSEFGGKAFAEFIGPKYAVDVEDYDICYNIMNGSTGILNPEHQLRILAGREAIRKLAYYACYTQFEESGTDTELDRAVEIIKAIKALAMSGAYVHPDSSFWYWESQDKDLAIPAGAKIYTYNGNNSNNEFMVLVHSDYAFYLRNDGYIGEFYDDNIKQTALPENLVYTAPENFAIDKAHSEGWEFSEESFEAVEVAEKQTEWILEGKENGAAYRFKQALVNIAPKDLEVYTGLTSKIYSFPVGIKQLLVTAIETNNVDVLDVVLWKISKNAYSTVTLEEKIDPTAIYAQSIKKGMIQADVIYDHWSEENVEAFVNDFHLPISFDEEEWEDICQAVADKIFELKKSVAVSASADASQDTANLDLSPISKTYGGMHTKQGYADQFGEEWMAKFYASDNNAQYRCDAEHYGNVLGRTFGFNNPQTFVRTIDGNYNVLQKIIEHNGSLNHVSPNSLNLAQLTSVMQEHVLDWWISNHDSWGENLLLSPDGKTIIGIDKGQAFKHSHDDKLAIGYLPKENPIPVWYDQFYNGVIDGSISAEVAEKVALKVLLKAFQVQSRHEERAHSLIESAMSKRSMWPNGHNKESFTKLILDRKSHLLADFETLYKNIFKAAGIEWTIDTESFGKSVGNAHISNSVIFAEEVRKASVFGKALFFNSLDIEDSHIMWTSMNQKDGGVCLLGFAKIRNTADAELTSWLKTRLVGGKETPVPVAIPKTITVNELPYIVEFVSRLISLSKTIKTHKEDGQYNSETIKQAYNTAHEMRSLLKSVENAETYETNKLVTYYFHTADSQAWWKVNAQELLAKYDIMLAAKDAHKSVKEYDSKFKKLNIDDYVYVAKEEPIEEEKPVETESIKDVQIAGKQMVVARRVSAQHGGGMDYNSGRMVQEQDIKDYYQTGYEYTVSYDDVLVHYRPWMESGVLKAQQGQLAIEVANWDGGHATIDDVLDTLGIMGIDVTPADAQSLELFYWRHLMGVIAERIPTTATSSIIKVVNQAKSTNHEMSQDQELQLIKDAWTVSYGQEIVDNANWKPRFNKHYNEIEGRPSWIRPDVTLDTLKTIYTELPEHNVISQTDGSRMKTALRILRTGRVLSTEERPRILGANISGMSSQADQKVGSSAFVFTRQNHPMNASDSEPFLILNPIIALRTNTYVFSGDKYGNIEYRKEGAPFEPQKMYTIGKGGYTNEMMVKNEAPVIGLVVGTEAKKKSCISELKADGITEINGRSIEDMIYTNDHWQSNKDKLSDSLWEWVIQEEKNMETESEK